MIHNAAAPDPSNEDACRRAAARLQHDHRHWMIMWGCYTRRYVAFPLFPAPHGTILTAVAPAELAAKMRGQERSAGMWVTASACCASIRPSCLRSPSPWLSTAPIRR